MTVTASAETRADWRRRTVAAGCRVCQRCSGPPEDLVVRAHHVVRQQLVRRRVAELAHTETLTAAESAALLERWLWDVRNGLGVCEGAHRRHHSRRAPIGRWLLPAAVFEFADELGLGYVLDREYPDGP